MPTRNSPKNNKKSATKLTPRSRQTSTRKTKTKEGSEPLSQEEVLKLLGKVERADERIPLLIGLTSGMRLSEIVSLEPINFDFDSGKVRIWDRHSRSYRSVYLPDEVLNQIISYIYLRGGSTTPRLFPYTTKALELKIEKVMAQILGSSRNWESVRNTYIQTSAMLDVPIRIIVENTGESPPYILKYYMKTPQNNIRRKINEILLYPEPQRPLVRSDDLKRNLEAPFLEKLNLALSSRRSADNLVPDRDVGRNISIGT